MALDDRMQQLLEHSKHKFVDKASQGSPRDYFRALKSLSGAPAAAGWDLMDLFPDCSPTEAGDKTATFFTRITDEFEPLAPPPLPAPCTRRAATLQEVEAALKKAKKPSSMVPGDILPRLMKAYHAKLARPVMKIFNEVFSSGQWPDTWKNETVVVIPKTPRPENLSECRNISCTPFLSKVLESLLLEDLRREIPLDPTQYGGIRNSSVDHLLVDLIDAAMSPLEDGGASILLGIDYEKAFNRMDHAECLRQLASLGASSASVSLVHSFLSGRTMRVRVGDSLSAMKPLRGGSPQGSILGCFLYCITTQQIGPALHVEVPDQPGPQDMDQESPPRPDPGSDPVPTEPDSPSGGFGLLDAAGLEASPTRAPQLAPLWSPARDWISRLGRLISMFKYVDDSTTVEAVGPGRSVKHFTTGQTLEQVPADLTHAAMTEIVRRAEEIGMRVNCKKTQLLCISGDNGCLSSSNFTVEGVEIGSIDQVKLLGFILDSSLGMAGQVDMIKKKFRAKFWCLIHLRRAGISGTKLYKLYGTLVRPVIETNSVIYHSMLNKSQAEELEKLHRQVLRLCFGFHASANDHLQHHDLKTLEERRVLACRKFISKVATTNPRFREKWLVRRPEAVHDLRTRRPYVEKRARTKRYFDSPLLALQRLANDIHS